MQSKIKLNMPFMIVSIVIMVIFSIVFLFVIPNVSISAYSLPNTSPTISEVTQNLTSGVPIRIKISKIKVNAPIRSLGLTAEGAMETTKGPDDVAWFNLGPRPGEKGSAVIAGHYGVWKSGKVSVFNKLNTLIIGDKISITNDKGVVISFIVRQIKKYDLHASASEVFSSSDGKSHLNLITCIQDPISKLYSKRLVVFTDKI